MSLRELGQRIRDMADAEHVDEGGEEVRKRSLHDREWPGYDTLDLDERIRFWAILPCPGTPARVALERAS